MKDRSGEVWQYDLCGEYFVLLITRTDNAVVDGFVRHHGLTLDCSDVYMDGPWHEEVLASEAWEQLPEFKRLT